MSSDRPRIMVAPDSFKDAASAVEVAAAVARGVRRAVPGAIVDCVPLADGGEGTVDALVAAAGGEVRHVTVTGPHGEAVVAGFGLLDGGATAVVEVAAASGLQLVAQSDRTPDGAAAATSRGTGEVMRAALDAGVEQMIVGLGGSATSDGGVGLLAALGVRVVDADGREVGDGGVALAEVHAVDLAGLDPRLAAVEVVVASDVDNPLLGPSGAAATYARQKGADDATVARIEHGLTMFAEVVRRDLGIDLQAVSGGGAAGGIGAALGGVLGAAMRPGIEVVLDAVGFDQRVAAADLVVTGEGRFDDQSLHGKVPIGVARAASRAGVPVGVLAGVVRVTDRAALRALGIVDAVAVSSSDAPLAQALATTPANLERVAQRVVPAWLAAGRARRVASD